VSWADFGLCHEFRGVLAAFLAVSFLASQDDAKINKLSGAVAQDDHPTPPPAFIDAGRKLFQNSCSACHGPSGGGGHGPSLVAGDRIRSLSDAQLFQSIQKGVPGTEMPPSSFSEPQIRQVAAFVRSLSAPAIESAVPGDPEAGRSLFFGKAGCVSCHMFRGEGGFLGPDLSDAGVHMTLGQMRESLLQPDKRIADGFQGITVVTQTGERIQGIAKNQDNYSVQLMDKQGHLHLLAKADLKTIEVSDHSLMPNDFGTRLSPAETQNILSYLSRQSVHQMETK
jgi:putative heme-binding domain-containing protein